MNHSPFILYLAIGQKNRNLSLYNISQTNLDALSSCGKSYRPLFASFMKVHVVAKLFVCVSQEGVLLCLKEASNISSSIMKEQVTLVQHKHRVSRFVDPIFVHPVFCTQYLYTIFHYLFTKLMTVTDFSKMMGSTTA